MYKNYNQLNKFLSLISMILAIFATVSVSSFAWTAINRNVSDINNNMQIGDFSHPEVTIYTYFTKTEADSEGWQTSSITKINSYTTEINGFNTYENGKFTISSLPLGTVDNLVKPKKDNIVYIRFAVDLKEGDTFYLTVHNDASRPFKIYDKENNEVLSSNAVYENIRDVISSGSLELLEFQYAVTTNSSLKPDDQELEGNFVKSNTTKNSFTADSTTAYYLFVKLYPNPNAFANIVKKLYTFMPCVFLYDFSIEYEIKLGE